MENSIILDAKDRKELYKMIEGTTSLLYRGSRDGFSAIDFHMKCDGEGSTICIIRSDKK